MAAARLDWFSCPCGAVFNSETADRAIELERSVEFGQARLEETIYLRCPCCRSEDFEEFQPCAECLERRLERPNEAIDGADLCPEHLRRTS